MRYMVFEIATAKTSIVDSMDELLDKFRCVTEARVKRCIESGESWKGLTFDEVEDTGDFFESHPEANDYASDEDDFDFDGVNGCKASA